MPYPKLKGTVQAAPNESVGFNVDSVLSFSKAQSFYNDNYRFCLRYLSIYEAEQSSDLTPQEANDILEAGLALMPVQHAHDKNWIPSAHRGITYGKRAAEHADQVGFPPKVNVWCDLEGIASDVSPHLVSEYCNKWYEEVASYGYLPGLYVGADIKHPSLNEEQLYENLKFQHYWKSASRVPDVAKRGYQMIQHLTEHVHGLDINRDISYIDKFNGRPQWLVRY